MGQADVAVVGVGAMGAATMWRLAARGARVVGFERFSPGHDRGSSHGESRIIRTAYFEDPRYVPLVRSAFGLWRRLEADTGTALLTTTGALTIGAPDGTLVAGVLASAREHGLDHELLDAARARRRFPRHRLATGEVAVYEQAAGVLRPESAVAAMAQAAERLGARLHRDTEVLGLDAGPGGVEVRTAGGAHRARHAVVAVGAWLGSLLPGLGLPLRIERQVQVWFPVGDPAAWRPGRCPVWIDEVAPGRHRYGLPSLDGRTIKVAAHHEGTTTTADELDRQVHPADLEPACAYVRERLDGVGPVPARAAVCMYTNTPDRHFVVGPAPGLAGVTVLSACSGHGFKFAPVIGEVAADLALEGGTTYPIGLFAPERLLPHRSMGR